MQHLGYFEEAVGMGQPETGMGNFGLIAAQFVAGGMVAQAVSPKPKKYAFVEGGIAGVAAALAAQAIMPMDGTLFWARALMVPAGVGGVIGIVHEQQEKKEERARMALMGAGI